MQSDIKTDNNMSKPIIFSPLSLAKSVEIACKEFKIDNLPKGTAVKEELGIVAANAVKGKVVHRSDTSLFETRATITPGGDYLLMFPEGEHYSSHDKGDNRKLNDMMVCRSKDKGATWSKAEIAFDIDYNQHGFIPLIPHGSNRIYAFGTQPVREYMQKNGLHENAPIGYRYSDDDGYTWSKVSLIAPINDPDFVGMSVMRMCETDDGTWILGSHEADWSSTPLKTRLYLLRSEDCGETWELLPGSRPDGWYAKGFDRMDEGRPINLGNGKLMMMARTATGRLWASWSNDDGKTWSCPAPTPLIHPDASPMVFHLSDGKTLAAFHHNRFHDLNYEGLTMTSEDIMKDRSEIWVSFSIDEGKSWTEPRFVFANAAYPDLENPFRNHQCSYIDMFMDDTTVNLIVPHRWQQVLHLKLPEKLLRILPTAQDLDFV